MGGTIYIITILSLFTGWFQNSLSPTLHPFEINGYAQGTTFHILYYAEDSSVTRNQIDSIFNDIDNSLSIYKSNSLINRFNSSDSGVNMDQHLRLVIEKSMAIYKDSEGLFDITIYPVVRAWGFGNAPVSAVPDAGMIQSFMRCVGSEKIFVDHNLLRKKIPCVQIDVNGIAQGYTVDVIADFMDRHHIHDYLVEVGGELRVSGHKQPGNEQMRIGIESPSSDKYGVSSMKKIISISHGAVTTSGTSRKQYKVGNKIISHLMNPKTGYPVDNEMISATVIADHAITSDGYDNVLMGLGVHDALIFMQRHKDMEAYLIYYQPDGTIVEAFTPGFQKLIQKNP